MRVRKAAELDARFRCSGTAMGSDEMPNVHQRLAEEDPTVRGELHDPLRVLLVEDAPFLRYAFGRLLRLHGFEVREATDGQEALDSLADFHPQLVLTDVMMPVMDGIELIRRLQDRPETANVPVVAITADATEQTEQLAREAGAVDVITKPIDLPALLERLRALPMV
jgi:CheY-like chemotaxis protein